ncbi:MAG: hypothetical protein KUG81_09290 [Gammaproteobacteria bacterium]|nr:hypothetical protein [Gammaproteobacteria bacterium]
MKRLLFLCVCIFSLPVLCTEIAVVVSADSSAPLIRQQEVSNIFLSKTNRFVNGEKTIPLEINNRSLRAEFYNNITDKTPGQLKSYWTTLIFSGKGKPPKSFASKEGLLDYMLANAGTIAYMPLSEVTAEMKVIYLVVDE